MYSSVPLKTERPADQQVLATHTAPPELPRGAVCSRFFCMQAQSGASSEWYPPAQTRWSVDVEGALGDAGVSSTSFIGPWVACRLVLREHVEIAHTTHLYELRRIYILAMQ